MKFASRLVSFNVAPGDPFRPMATPIYQTATFEQEEATAFGPYDYSRSGNPTRTVLEEQVAALENGTRGFCFSSGMAAISYGVRGCCGQAMRSWPTATCTAEPVGCSLGSWIAQESRRVTPTPVTRRLRGSDHGSYEARVPGVAHQSPAAGDRPAPIAEIAHAHGALFGRRHSACHRISKTHSIWGPSLYCILRPSTLRPQRRDGGVAVAKDEALAKEIYFSRTPKVMGRSVRRFLFLRGIKT